MHYRINIPSWGAAELRRGAAVLASGGLRSVYRRRLLRELQAFLPHRTATLTSSGRHALALAIERLGLAGRRIIIPAYVCPAVPAAIDSAGAQAVVVDCIPNSTKLLLDDVERLLSNRLADAVLAPATYGVEQEMTSLEALCSTYTAPLIEDAAYQAGRRDEVGRACGGRGDAGVWSFNFKTLAGIGGGVLWIDPSIEQSQPKPENIQPIKRRVIRSTEIIRWLNYAARSQLRQHAPKSAGGAGPISSTADWTLRTAARMPNTFLEMSELQASAALSQWEGREHLFAVQQANTASLLQAIADCPTLEPLVGAAAAAPPHVMPILVRGDVNRSANRSATDDALQLRRALHERGVQTEAPYPVQHTGGQVASATRHASAGCNAADLAARLVLVPCGASLGPRDINHIAEALVAAAKHLDRRMAPHRAPEAVA